MLKEEKRNKVPSIIAEIAGNVEKESGHEEDKSPSQSQTALDSITLAAGSLDITMGFRQCLKRAIRASGKDQYMIAGEIDRLTKSDFSKSTLEKSISNNPTYGIHAEWLTAFCHVVGTFEPFQYLLEPLGYDVQITKKANDPAGR